MRPTLGDVRRLGERLLEEPLDPVVRYRVGRDVLGHHSRIARQNLLKSPQVRELEGEQLQDGSWGRLHSGNSRLKRRKFPTTEAAVERALALGLGRKDPILSRARRFLSAVVRGTTTVSDPPEKNDRWPTGVELFAAATLARFDPDNHVLDKPWQRWAQIVRRVFGRGTFDAQAEIDAHRELHGVRDGVQYLTLATRYAVALLGARAHELPLRLRRSYARWLWSQTHGLGYIGVRCWPPPRQQKQIPAWLFSIDLLHPFLDGAQMRRMAEGIWSCRTDDGLWDFGPDASALRISRDGRAGQRHHDHSLAVLALLARCLRKSTESVMA